VRLVMKFGGTSVGSAAAIRRAAELIRDSRDDWPEVVAVVSAMSGVTDLLLEGAYGAASGQAVRYHEITHQLRRKYQDVLEELFAASTEAQDAREQVMALIHRYESLCNAVLVLGELSPRALDAISAMGEPVSARLLAACLRLSGQDAEAVDATRLIVTDDTFQSAVPLASETILKSRAQLLPLLARGVVPVVTGFIGATSDGITTTLGRGGSDYSASILGQALEADEVWIWTDVDGVMTADPRLVPEARSIEVLSFREVAELAYYGAKVLHPRAIRPVIDEGIPLRIKNTFKPDHPGTMIVREPAESNGDVKAVTAIRDLSLINVEGKGMIGVPGIAARTFGSVARSRVSVLLISQASSEQSICFAVPLKVSSLVVAELEAGFAIELARQDIDRIWAMEPVAIVTAVGAGMRGTYGIAGRIFGALGANRVNIIAIAQGSSECSISMVVDDDQTRAAERAVHTLIVNREGGEHLGNNSAS
jgi:bifunctional aspartokinase / homoserine dehydrogenase 1